MLIINKVDKYKLFIDLFKKRLQQQEPELEAT